MNRRIVHKKIVLVPVVMFTFLECLGVLCIFLVMYQSIKILWNVLYEHVVGPCVKCVPNFKQQGKWALITGATDGIGKAFAEALAEREINLILISRSMTKLKTVANELERKYNIETKVIEADFTKVDIAYTLIGKCIFGYEIGILINNVGLSYPYPEYFLSLSESDNIYTSIINCNIFSVTNMCKLVMPGMVERNKGIIINISSTAAQIPSPLLTVYGASKAYIEKFTADLSTEYNKFGIIIQCLLPGYVATKMSKIRKSTWMAPTPEDYVKYALRTTGVRTKSTGYYPHSLLMGVIHFINYFSANVTSILIMQIMNNIRLRALRRQIM